MLFNPEEIGFHGFSTSLLVFLYGQKRSGMAEGTKLPLATYKSVLEKYRILLEKYPAIISQAAAEHNPSAIVNYCYDVAKTFNSFVTEHRVGSRIRK